VKDTKVINKVEKKKEEEQFSEDIIKTLSKAGLGIFKNALKAKKLG
jgi:hypothetical protein